jgi:hypothetical protein
MMKFNEDGTVSIDKVKTIVFTENDKQLENYFGLFTIMLYDNASNIIVTRDYRRIEGDDFIIEFRNLCMASRGHKAHFVINLVQDKVLHNELVEPMTSIFDYLKRDEKWRGVFEDTRS